MEGRTVRVPFSQATAGNKMYKDTIYKYCLSWNTDIFLIRRRRHRHHHHHYHHTSNLITLQPLWMLHTYKFYTFCRYMILTVTQGGGSFAETSFIWKIQIVKWNSGFFLPCSIFSRFRLVLH